MFVLTMGAGLNIGLPDVCKTPTPVGTLPIPYPNLAISATTLITAPTVLCDCMPTVVQLSIDPISQGDDPGLAGGIITNTDMCDQFFIIGSTAVFAEGLPVQRLTSITGQNAEIILPNAPGATLVPSQCQVLALR